MVKKFNSLSLTIDFNLSKYSKYLIPKYERSENIILGVFTEKHLTIKWLGFQIILTKTDVFARIKDNGNRKRN